MKHIAIISLALVPLLTASSSSVLGPRLAPETERTQSVSAIHSELRKLRRRVRALNRRVAAQANRPAPETAASARDISEIKTRITELEAVRIPARPGSAGGNVEQDVADLAKQLALLSRKVDERGAATTSPSGPVGANTGTQALDKRLTELQAAQKATSDKFDNMETDLNKDRTLVIDYLEDLDKRIEALEKAKPSPAKP